MERDVLREVPTYRRLLAATRAVARRHPDLVAITAVGESEAGEPIDMISIGDGPMSALSVGAPHSNEVIGCLVIERLIDRLCNDAAFRRELPYRWHFIKAIEPDAFRLNEGWFSMPGDLASYFRNYYRPPIDQQAEYLFPFAPDDRWDRHPTAENLSWRTAIKHAQPDFMFSLHNAEFGGAFYLASHVPMGLADELVNLCGKSGLTINPIGDTALDGGRVAHGVQCFPDMKNFHAGIPRASIRPGQRTVGNSSANYARAGGTFSLIAEVPYWDSDRLRDESDSGHTQHDVDIALESWTREVVLLAERALALDYSPHNLAAAAIWKTVREHYEHFSAARIAGRRTLHDDRLTCAEYARRVIGGKFERLGTVGLAQQLALASLDRLEGLALADDCDRAMDAQIDGLIQSDGVYSVPLDRLIGHQLEAGLISMRALARERTLA